MAERLHLSREEYRDAYLRSEHWLAQRQAALERADQRCQVCNSAKALDVHHRTYERLGCELPTDLTVLCRGCHETFHGTRQTAAPKKKPKKKTKKRPKRTPPGKQLLRDSMAEMRARNVERPLRMSDYGATVARLEAEAAARQKAKQRGGKR